MGRTKLEAAVRTCDDCRRAAHHRGHSTARRGASWLCDEHVQDLHELTKRRLRQLDGNHLATTPPQYLGVALIPIRLCDVVDCGQDAHRLVSDDSGLTSVWLCLTHYWRHIRPARAQLSAYSSRFWPTPV